MGPRGAMSELQGKASAWPRLWQGMEKVRRAVLMDLLLGHWKTRWWSCSMKLKGKSRCVYYMAQLRTGWLLSLGDSILARSDKEDVLALIDNWDT